MPLTGARSNPVDVPAVPGVAVNVKLVPVTLWNTT
jgi:hypothetical protein